MPELLQDVEFNSPRGKRHTPRLSQASMANIVCVRGKARKSTHVPRSMYLVHTRVMTAARLVVGALAVAAICLPATVDTDSASTPNTHLVDDGGSYSPDPPYHSPSTSHDSKSNKPDSDEDSHKEHGSDSDSADQDGSAGMPIAAQAGISVGVIGLAALALIPGRRPPASLQG